MLAVAAGGPTIFVGIVAAVTCLYRFAVGKPMRLRFLLPGAVAATISMIVLLVGFGAYASASTHYTAIYGAFAITLRANQIVAGMAINMLALGLTPFCCKLLFDVTGSTPTIPFNERLQIVPLWLAWVAVLGCFVFFGWMRGGLRLSFAGENPAALHAAGISVSRIRWLALLAGGALAGVGGATLSICLSSSFSRNMTAGRGFIALAALIFGKWKPIPAALACLLFGFAEAVQIRLQGSAIGGVQIPVQLIQVLPYLLTVVVLRRVWGTRVA